MYITFAKTLTLLRKYRGLTQEDLAKKVGVHSRSIQNYESLIEQREPNLKALIRISEALDVPIEILRSHNDEAVRKFIGVTDESEKPTQGEISVALEEMIRKIVRDEIKKQLVKIYEGLY